MAKKVALMCGHGMQTNGVWDSGCCYGSYTEAALMLPITKAAVKYLRASGVSVISDADSNNNKNCALQISWSNSWDADIFISVHCDWYKAASGVMPLYVSSGGKKLATALNNAIKSGMSMKSRGCVKRTDLRELNQTNAIAVILETGSIKADLNTLKNKPDEYGKCIAKGICNYFGITFKDGSEEKKTEPKETKELYRVRSSWKDAKSQVGAFENLENAKVCADVNHMNVYNSKGSNVYSAVKETVYYRVRKSWADAKSQLGAFQSVSRAKALCKQHPGYHVFNENGAIIYSAPAPTTADRLIEKLEEIETEMRKLGFKYSNSGKDHGDNWTAAKKKKYTNCATYVSWALQEIGILSSGDLFYCKNKKINNQRGKAVDHLKAKATVTVVNATPKNAGLKIGDICGYTTHTMVFAGWENGAPTWYTMGSGDIGKNLPRVRSDYSNRKIEIRIRLK